MAWPWRGERPTIGRIDRLVVQQFDPRRTVTIGGIVTCLRGVLDYAPPGVTVAIVGVDDSGSADSPLGRWQTIRRGDRDVWFLPVARIDSTRPKGFVPHSARLVAGLLRYRARIPRAASLQAHRVDVGLVTRAAVPWPAGVLHSHTGARPARADVGLVLAVAGQPPRAAGPRCRAAGGAGDRVQPGLRREGAAVEPAYRLRAYLVRPRDHHRGPRPGSARRRLGRAGSRSRRTPSSPSGPSPRWHKATRTSRGRSRSSAPARCGPRSRR